MAEGEALLAQGLLHLGAAQPGAEGGGQRAAIDRDLAQGAEVEADEVAVGAAHRLDPADHAGAAAEGHDRDARGGAGVDCPSQRLGVGRHKHRVGGALKRSVAQACQIHVTAPGGVAQPVLVSRKDVGLPNRVDYRLRQRLGSGQLELLQRPG